MRRSENLKDIVIIAACFSFVAAFVIILMRKYLFRKMSLLYLVVYDESLKGYVGNRKFVSEIEIMANNFRYRARSRSEVRTATNTVGHAAEFTNRRQDSGTLYDIDDSKEEITDFVESV